jgi:PRTRC genetic system protein A
VLEHARNAGRSSDIGLARPVEQQYFVTFEAGKLRVKVPPQDSSSTRIRYQALAGALIDIHSHHSMAAYFSSTDDQDDTGLSVSAVVGTIFTNPKIVCRVNVHGHRQIVPALTIFDTLPGIEDKYADIDD